VISFKAITLSISLMSRMESQKRKINESINIALLDHPRRYSPQTITTEKNMAFFPWLFPVLPPPH
jgi:hypothetical protein